MELTVNCQTVKKVTVTRQKWKILTVNRQLTIHNLPSNVLDIFYQFKDYYLRNRKHVPCFYRVTETRGEVWKNEKCCGNTSRRRVFPQLLRVLLNFHECFYNSINTENMFSISFRKHRDEKNENNLLNLTIEM